MAEVERIILTTITIVKEEITNTLSYLGEQCVVKVRDRSGAVSWFDQTGNLRSSIGYAIYEEGRKEIESAFNVVKNGIQGSEEGKKLIDELAVLYSNTYALVVVAGMNYAEFVEARDNKDVLASAELFARKKVNSYLNKAMKRAKQKIERL